MRKGSIISMAICALLCVGLLAGCRSAGGDGRRSSLGVATDKIDDTFMTGMRNVLKAAADADGIKTDIIDSQDGRIDAFLTGGMDALCVSPVDRTAAGPIITENQKRGEAGQDVGGEYPRRLRAEPLDR